jgi:hypothetical protein
VAAVVDGRVHEIDYCRAKLELPAVELNPPPLITGDDLKAAGIPPGPAYQHLLEAVRDAQLTGEIDSHTAAMALAQRLTSSPSPFGRGPG